MRDTRRDEHRRGPKSSKEEWRRSRKRKKGADLHAAKHQPSAHSNLRRTQGSQDHLSGGGASGSDEHQAMLDSSKEADAGLRKDSL